MPTPATTPKPEIRAPRSFSGVRRSEGPEIPQIADGTYIGHIKEVGESTSTYNGETRDQLLVTFEILDDDLRLSNGNYLELRAYISIPPTLATAGTLNENSNMYALMQALGYDMKAEMLDVIPSDWQGMECQVSVENKAIKEGQNAGQVRPRITAYTRLPKGMLSNYAANADAPEPPPPPPARTPAPRPASAPPPRPAASTVRRTSQATAAPAPAATNDDNDF